MRSSDYLISSVDEDRSLLFLTGNHRAFAIEPELGERLREAGVDGLEGEELNEWEALGRAGLVSEENPAVLARSTFADGADLAINVNLTHACNLACTYCFAQGGDYGRMTKPMSAESVDQIFEFIDREVTDSECVRLEFFGGEPLANPRIIEMICKRSEEVTRLRGIRFLYRISTNLTLLPKRVLERFARHRFVVSVSLDGGPEVQDKYRPTKGGRGSYERIIRNVEAVRAAGEDITIVARMTIASPSPRLLPRVRQLWSLNLFDYFQIYPAVYRETGEEISGSGCSDAPGEGPPVNAFMHGEMPEQFREFLAAYPSLFDTSNRFKGVLEYERTAEMILEGKLALSFCSGGRVYYTHSPNEVISPCHRLAGDEEFDVGTGSEGLNVEHGAWRRDVDSHPTCSACWARYICGGGCKQENQLATGDLNDLNPDSCGYQLMLAEEVLKMVARAPAEYRERDRDAFSDLFVSCGRPVVASERRTCSTDEAASFRHFKPLVGVDRDH